MKVYSTTDYKKFKYLVGNRKKYMQHVKEIVDQIKKKDLTPFRPVEVNERMEVIDGQHRIKALEILKRPVHYIVISGLRLEDATMSNLYHKNWNIQDFIQSYIDRGNKEYEKLYEFMRNFNLPAGTSASILLGIGDGKAGEVTRYVRKGLFKIANYDKAIKIGDFISKCRKFVPVNVRNHRDFWHALIKVQKNYQIDKNKFIHKLSYLGSSLIRLASEKDYLREFERFYGHRDRNEDTIRFF